MAAQTLLDKLWQRHVVSASEDGTTLLYVDRHLVYEVTSPQAFEGLRMSNRKPWRAATVLATADHNVPTTDRSQPIADPLSRVQVQQLDVNCRDFGITAFGLGDRRQGIIHVVGPEQGATLPGMTVVAGDSHTSTHGAFAALAFGVGTSDVEHVLATQCLSVQPMQAMAVNVHGTLRPGVSAKDLVLALIARIGAGGATGGAIEFRGEGVRALSMEGRMTLCNMAIEGGARVGLVAVDDKTIDYLRGRPYAPSDAQWARAETFWRTLVSDPGARFDRTVDIDAATVAPMVTWGTSPQDAVAIDGAVPSPPPRPTPCAATAWCARCATWAWNPAPQCAISSSTRSSSAPAPTRALRICAAPLPSCAGATYPRACGWRWPCPVPGWSRRRQRQKACTKSFWLPVSSGASRAAQCAWA